jgi:selenocysteine lyase/cysteine desulfurase
VLFRSLVDAAQLVAHRQVKTEAWGIDYLAFSAHKVYAPFGSGVLLVRKELLKFSPAELELIHSSGEENIGGIAALGKALVLLQRIGLDLVQEEEQALTGQALRGLAQIAGIKVYGVNDPGSPRFNQKGGVIIFSLKGVLPGQVAKQLAEQGGIGVRSGCHCAHLLVKHLLHIPPALQQFQGLVLTLFPQLALPGVVRVSLGIENRPEDVDTLIAVLDKIARQSQARVGRSGTSRNTGTPGLPRAEMDDFTRAAAEKVYDQFI